MAKRVIKSLIIDNLSERQLIEISEKIRKLININALRFFGMRDFSIAFYPANPKLKGFFRYLSGIFFYPQSNSIEFDFFGFSLGGDR